MREIEIRVGSLGFSRLLDRDSIGWLAWLLGCCSKSKENSNSFLVSSLRLASNLTPLRLEFERSTIRSIDEYPLLQSTTSVQTSRQVSRKEKADRQVSRSKASSLQDVKFWGSDEVVVQVGTQSRHYKGRCRSREPIGDSSL